MSPNHSSSLRFLRRGAAASLIALSLPATCGLAAPAAEPNSPTPAPPSPETIALAIVDDFTGGKAQGALDINTAPQLRGLLEIIGVETLQLGYFLIQERVTAPVTVTLPGWEPPPLPNPPSEALPYDEHLRETTKFLAAVKAAQEARSDWQTKTVANLDSFLNEDVSAQKALAERWADELKKRGLLDFRRSSVAATIIAAAQSMPASAKHSFLVLATDGIDEPPGRPGRRTTFTEIEVPPRIHLIYLTPDGKIPPSPLFVGLRNPWTAVKDLAGAVAYIKNRI